MKIPIGIRCSLENAKKTATIAIALRPTPVDAAGGHCYQISTAMQVNAATWLRGVRLSNAWSIYRREGHNLGKLRLMPYKLKASGKRALVETVRELERYRSVMGLRRIRQMAG